MPMIVPSKDGIQSGIEVLKSLDSLCMGLKSFLRREEKDKKTIETKKDEGKKEKSESRFSVVNRSRTALSEIEWTLREMIEVIGREEEDAEENEGRREISEKIGGMLIRHFTASLIGSREKKEAVIGIDIGRLRVEMEENEKRRETERKMEREDIRKEKEELKRKKEEIARNEDERRKKSEELKRKEDEIARQMAELQAEREANQQLIKEGLERQKEKEREKAEEAEREKTEEEERGRQSKVGAAAIEFYPPSAFSLTGDKFTKTVNSWTGNLLSFEFDAVVARLSLIVGCVPRNKFDIGIVSSTISNEAQTTPLHRLTGGAGCWELIVVG
ncbi:hypothetical protein BLNAU_6123 [Blattamonas nauphoetae]|uniref:Uncharacterized protein n=1 Tax=Blattamonas nauphoetae TaxID=2049346 RepID=A0ABQ9Y575_9EUKA|nr:hypothetical protein BLNAU_6123 [Blattamonas nauphoetae]